MYVFTLIASVIIRMETLGLKLKSDMKAISHKLLFLEERKVLREHT